MSCNGGDKRFIYLILLLYQLPDKCLMSSDQRSQAAPRNDPLCFPSEGCSAWRRGCRVGFSFFFFLFIVRFSNKPSRVRLTHKRGNWFQNERCETGWIKLRRNNINSHSRWICGPNESKFHALCSLFMKKPQRNETSSLWCEATHLFCLQPVERIHMETTGLPTHFLIDDVMCYWSDPWLHYQDSSERRCDAASEVIGCNVTFVFCWIIKKRAVKPSHSNRRAAQARQTFWEWWVSSWCHPFWSRRVTQSASVGESRSELISYFPNLRNSIKYGLARAFSTSVAPAASMSAEAIKSRVGRGRGGLIWL